MPETTPDRGRAIQGHAAGFVTRLAANLIDMVVLAITWFGFIAFIGLARFVAHPLRGWRLPEPATWVSGVTICILAILYLTIGWSGTGRSVGKRMAGLRVHASSGAALGTGRALVRAALYVVFPIGFLWVLVSRKNRSAFDILLATTVIYDWGLRSATPRATAVPQESAGER
jgi:uncharacterized RDD family membrane protein YckC